MYNVIKKASLNSKSLIEIVKELNPSLTGFLHLDGKAKKTKGESKHFLTLFIGFDSKGFPIHQRLIEGENKLKIMKFIDEIEKELNYPFKGIISDMKEEIIQAVAQLCPKFLINSAKLTS